MAEVPDGRVSAFRPNLADLTATIRRIAAEDRRVYLSNHARERMDIRTITRVDVIRALARGHIDGPIVPGDRPGEWKCKVVANVKGSRDIGVIALVIGGDRILVKTVEWED